MERGIADGLRESVFCLNSKLSGREIYIEGTDRKAVRLFAVLTMENIRIAGFVSRELKGGILYNRPVMDPESLKDSPVVVLVDGSDSMEAYVDTVIYEDVFVLNPVLREKEIYIYGAGVKGTGLCERLALEGIEIKCFVDSDCRKQGLFLAGHEIRGIRVLSGAGSESVVIACGEHAYGIRETVVSQYPGLNCMLFFDHPLHEEKLWVDRQKKAELKLATIAWLQEKKCSQKELILFGRDNDLLRRYRNILNTAGFSNVTLSSDHTDDGVIQIEEIIYRSDYYLLVCDEDSLNEQRWKTLSVPVSRIYNLVEGVVHIGECLIDTGTGHTYLRNSDIPGFFIHETKNPHPYNIVVLGGSTTDWVSREWGIRSWPELLFEEHMDEHLRLFNGGIIGYDSSREWVKFYRDVMKIRPDMVIVYDGYNDTISHPWKTSFLFLESMIEDAKKRIKRFSFMEQSEKVWKGIRSDKDVVEDWLNNIEMMHAVADDRDISFHAFIQPMLMSKQAEDIHTMSLKVMYEMSNPAGGVYKDNALLFRSRAPQIAETHDYIHDLSNIFDHEDVYMDSCHVYEKGNRIISDAVWNVIKDDVRKKGEKNERYRCFWDRNEKNS